MKNSIKKKKYILATIVAIIIMAIVPLLATPNKAYAVRSEIDTSKMDVVKKALFEGYYGCYTDTRWFPESFEVFDGKFTTLRMNFTNQDVETAVKLPNGLTRINDNNVKCQELLEGYRPDKNSNTFSGFFSLYGINQQPTTDAAMKNFASQIGYEETVDSQYLLSKCRNFRYNVLDENGGVIPGVYIKTMNICLANGAITVTSNNDVGSDNAAWDYDPYWSVGSMFEVYEGNLIVYSYSPTESNNGYFSYSDYNDWDSYISAVTAFVASKNRYIGKLVLDSTYQPEDVPGKIVYRFPFNEGHYYSGTWIKERKRTEGAKRSISNIGGYDSYDALKFSNEEMIKLLTLEIEEWLFSDTQTNKYWVCNVDLSSPYYNGFKSIAIGPDAKIGEGCGILTSGVVKTSSSVDDTNSNTIYGFINGHFAAYGNVKRLTITDAIDEINRLVGTLSQTEKDQIGVTTDTGVFDGGDSTLPDASVNDGGETDACYSGSGAMGWIICPVTAAVSGVGNWAWEIIEKNFLVIDTNGLFGNSGVNSAWGTIRDIANIAFIIVVLVIIFSQLTGVGIDNYGIKKMLPKIIVAAVLVNLSLIICQLCVEVSNIVGQSVRSWLTNLAPTAGAGMSTGGAVGSGMLGVALGAGGMGLYALLNGTTLGGAFAALGLAVLGIVIVIVFAILVLYIILVIREAGVVLLIIISPIALTCRILPNTEKLYKKWFDLFKAVLVVYPLCSFMVGAGQLAGSILSQLDSSSMKVAAMVVQVVPFILIPSLLKSSLSLMGNIGNKLSGWGRGLGRGAKGSVNRGITNSQGYKRMTDGFNLKKASKYDDRMQKRMRKGKNLSESQQAKLAQARGTILKAKNEEINNGQMSNNDMYDYMGKQQESKAESDRIKVRSDVLGQESRGKFGKTYTDSTGTHDGFLMAGIKSGKIEGTLAALDTMESSGYNKEMLDVLMDKDGNIVSHFEAGQQQRIFAKLAGSSDAVLQAYGKEQLKAMDKGETVKSLADFMSGGKGDGVTNTMASYLDAKGNVVLNGQNDDTIKFIMVSDSAKTDVTDRIMTDNDIISVARNPKDNKVTSAIIESLKSRGGLQQEISARQLADIKSMDMFNAMVPTSADIDRVLGTAIKDMANDRSNKLLSSLDPEIRKVIQAKVDTMRSGTASGGSADTTYHPEDE